MILKRYIFNDSTWYANLGGWIIATHTMPWCSFCVRLVVSNFQQFCDNIKYNISENDFGQ